MLWKWKLAVSYARAKCTVERQDLSCMYLAHHELESILVIGIIVIIIFVIFIIIVITIIVIVIIIIVVVIIVTI